MEADKMQEISERDQLWASLRDLEPEIQRLAEGHWTASEREQRLSVLLARIVVAELRFRNQSAAATE